MLEDCLTRQDGTSKFVLGALAYFFTIYRPRHRAELELR
jgi:hypothetical protein